MRIVVAGGTGFLGTALGLALTHDGHEVAVLTRRPSRAHHVAWDPEAYNGQASAAIDGADVVVNLAGESIADRRWTPQRKSAIRGSRITATKTLVRAIHAARRPPAAFLSGSAVGVYGARHDELVTEQSPSGSDFLAAVCRDWEREALEAAGRTRVVLLRTGLVLARDAGALPQLALPFRFFAGGPLGSGRQYMSWVHIDDWVEMVRWALKTNGVSGPLNVTAPGPVTNLEMARTLGRVLHRPALLPAPAAALRLALGEMADALLSGQRVVPEKAPALGFEFRYPTLEPALRNIYS